MSTGAAGSAIGRPTPRARAFVRRWVWPVVHLAFRPTLEGVENLPRDRPYLLVANHSAGIAIGELLSFGCLFIAQAGEDARLAGFAHPIGFRRWPLSAAHRELGTIPSTYEAAEAALAQGCPVLVFPGGDHECLRPIWRANVVDFNGRQGFLRIAQKAGVPIVPMGITGSHYTVPMLWRSKLLAKLVLAPQLFGTKRWGLSLLSVLGALAIALLPLPIGARVLLAWAWIATPLVWLPIVPWTIRMRIGTPLAVAPDLDVALREVQAAVQRQVDELNRR